MTKRLSVGICGLAVVCMTAGFAQARPATQDAKDRTAATHKSGAYLSDSEITSAVKTKLSADKRVSARHIGVETENGVVTLSGAAGTSGERAHAVSIARHTHGVRRVVDRIDIEKRHASNRAADRTDRGVKGTSGRVADDTKGAARKTGRVLSDAEITTAVKTKMIADSHVHAMDINVDTDNGVVTLNGSVRNASEKAEAMRVARHTHGVKRVVDRLAVK